MPNSRVSKFIKSEKYAEKIIGTQESISELFKRLSLNFKVQKKIFDYAKKRGIMIFSTPFDFGSADFLEKLGVSAFKIASADFTNLPLAKYHLFHLSFVSQISNQMNITMKLENLFDKEYFTASGYNGYYQNQGRSLWLNATYEIRD